MSSFITRKLPGLAPLVAAALLLPGGAALGQQASEAEPGRSNIAEKIEQHEQRIIEDTVITSMVETRLMADRKIDDRQLNVHTDNGEVILSGSLPDEESAGRAVELAEQVDGVRAVRLNLR